MTREVWTRSLQIRKQAYEQKAKAEDKRCYWQGRSYLQQYEESKR